MDIALGRVQAVLAMGGFVLNWAFPRRSHRRPRMVLVIQNSIHSTLQTLRFRSELKDASEPQHPI